MSILTFEKPVQPSVIREKSISKTDLFWLVPFLFVAIFPVFWQLTSIPIRQWDEARLAVNAAEMLENGKWFVTYFQNAPDMWNTKPPLQIWLIALSIKVFGYTEFAVRFPAALAVLGTMALLFSFCQRVFKSKVAAVLSVLVLASSVGYMGYHVARNGDYDALLVFFVTLYALAFFQYLEGFKTKHFWLCIIGLTFAVLTKGVAGLMCAPALLVYLIIRRKFLFLLKQKYFWFGVIVFLLTTLSYYFLREHLNAGYLKAVYENELGGRYLATLEMHAHPWDWYLDLMRDEKYTFWYYLFPFAVWLLIWQPNLILKRFALFGLLFISFYMIIISSAQTKLYWYDAPVYPMAAILIGSAFAVVFQLFQNIFSIKRIWLFYPLSIGLLIWGPYNSVLKNYLKEKAVAPDWHWETMFGPAMKAAKEYYPEYKHITFLQNSGQYNASAYFYQLSYAQDGYTFGHAEEGTILGFKAGDIVIVCNTNLRLRLEEIYNVQTLHEHYSSRVLKILDKKQ